MTSKLLLYLALLAAGLVLGRAGVFGKKMYSSLDRLQMMCLMLLLLMLLLLYSSDLLLLFASLMFCCCCCLHDVSLFRKTPKDAPKWKKL